MNQRILFPALVLGAVFAAALTALHTQLPSGDPGVAFAANAGVLVIALAVYGLLMQRALAPVVERALETPVAPRAPEPAGRDSGGKDRGGRDRKRGGGRSGGDATTGRGGRGDGGSSEKKSDRNSERKSDKKSEGGSGKRSEKNADKPERKADKAPEEKRDAPEVPAGPRETGRIKWFSGTKGFGFIIREDGSEIFVHHRGVRGRRRDLADGLEVSFVVVERQKGPQADDVHSVNGEDEDEA